MHEIARFLGKLRKKETRSLNLVEERTIETLIQQGRVPEKVPGPIEADFHLGAFYVIPPIGVGPDDKRVIEFPSQIVPYFSPDNENFLGNGRLTFVPEESVEECDQRIAAELQKLQNQTPLLVH